MTVHITSDEMYDNQNVGTNAATGATFPFARGSLTGLDCCRCNIDTFIDFKKSMNTNRANQCSSVTDK
jgi:hypothetical protein